MRDYSVEYANGVLSVLYYKYQRIGDGIVPKGVMAGDRPAATVLESGGAPVIGDGAFAHSSDDTNGATAQEMRPAGGSVTLPSGFRRLSDLRKRAPKKSYDDLKAWVGKTIRLDGVNFETGQRDGKTIIASGLMTFSEFDPSDPERETDQTVTTSIPRGALRALYEGLTKNPDETIVCDVVQSKRGLALQ